MAGFMAGFGEGFSNSFSQAVDRRQKQQDDIFKLQYERYITRKDYLDKQNQENAKRVKMAKDLVRMNGQPEEAWTSAYNLLAGGYDPDKVNKLLQDNVAVIAPTNQAATPGAGDTTSTAAPADPRDSMTQAASNSVDAQMASSGMTPPRDGGIFKQIFGRGRQQDMTNNANKKIAGMEGSTPEAVQSTVNSNLESSPIPGADNLEISWKPRYGVGGPRPDFFKASSSADAATNLVWAQTYGNPQDVAIAENIFNQQRKLDTEKARANGIATGNISNPSRGWIKNDDGSASDKLVHAVENADGSIEWRDENNKNVDPATIGIYGPDAEKEITRMSPDILKQSQDYNAGLTNLTDMARTADDLANIAVAHPESVNRISGGIASTANDYIRGFKGLGTILTGRNLFAKAEDGKLKPEDYGSWGGVIADNIQSLENSEKELTKLSDRIDDASYWEALAQIKATKLAYQYAATAGQTGRGVSQAEFENYYKSALGGGKPEAIKAGAAGYIQSQYQNLKDQARVAEQFNPAIDNFKNRFGAPFPYKVVGNVDEYLAGDPKMQAQIQPYLDAGQPANTGTLATQSQDNGGIPLPDQFKNDPDMIKLWPQFTDEERKKFLGL